MIGKDLAGKLMKIRPDIPVILCTGYSDQIDEIIAEAMGIRAFLTKPLFCMILPTQFERFWIEIYLSGGKLTNVTSGS